MHDDTELHVDQIVSVFRSEMISITGQFGCNCAPSALRCLFQEAIIDEFCGCWDRPIDNAEVRQHL